MVNFKLLPKINIDRSVCCACSVIVKVGLCMDVARLKTDHVFVERGRDLVQLDVFYLVFNRENRTK